MKKLVFIVEIKINMVIPPTVETPAFSLAVEGFLLFVTLEELSTPDWIFSLLLCSPLIFADFIKKLILQFNSKETNVIIMKLNK